MKKSILFASLASLILAWGCGMPATSGEKLRDSVMHFNESYRWGKFYTASVHVAVKKRKVFLENTIGTTVKITEFDIREVLHDKKKKEAYIIIKFTWYQLPSLRVHISTYRQHWKYVSRTWQLMDQKVLKKKVKKKKKRVSFNSPGGQF